MIIASDRTFLGPKRSKKKKLNPGLMHSLTCSHPLIKGNGNHKTTERDHENHDKETSGIIWPHKQQSLVQLSGKLADARETVTVAWRPNNSTVVGCCSVAPHGIDTTRFGSSGGGLEIVRT